MVNIETIQSFSEEIGDAQLKKVNTAYANEVFVGQKYIYKVAINQERIAKGDHLKEKVVFDIIHESLDKAWAHLIPNYVLDRTLPGDIYVQVHTKLPGSPPKDISHENAFFLGKFLSSLHKINQFSSITEFVGPESGDSNFSNYVMVSLEKFYGKLKTIISEKDLDLVDKGIQLAVNNVAKEFQDVELCLVHKDIYNNNLLVENGNITGIIDWEAAQTAPAEWELAIIMQRFPLLWAEFLKGYNKEINYRLLQICGIVQSLRYWKSFPQSDSFVAEQRGFLERMVNNDFC